MNTASNLHCFVSNVVLGLGINLPYIEEMIHWNPTGDNLSFWQEVGRCARHGHQGLGTLFIYPRSVDKIRVDENTRKLLSDVKHSKVCYEKSITDFPTQ